MKIAILIILSIYIFTALSLSADDKELIAHWTFEEKNSNLIIDSSCNKLNGNKHGVNIIEGPFGNAVELKSGAYIDISGRSCLTSEKITIMAWVKPQKTYYEKNQEIIDTGLLKRKWIYLLRLTPTPSVFRFQIKTSSGSYKYINGTTPVQLGKWYHVVAVSDSNFIKLYIDGKEDAKAVPCKGLNTKEIHDLLIGRGFIGSIDEIKFFSKALNGDEIKQEYSKGKDLINEYGKKVNRNTASKWIANQEYRYNHAWEIPRYMDKDFWMLLDKYKWNLSGVKDKEFVFNAGCARVPIALLKDSYNCFIREIKFINKRMEIIPYNVQQENIDKPYGALGDIWKMHDGDNNTFCYRMIPDGIQCKDTEIKFSFNNNTEIKEINLSDGYFTGNEYIYTMSNFVFQYWDNNKWIDIVETETEKSSASEHLFQIPNIKTSVIRLLIKGGYVENYSKYIDENKPYFLAAQHVRHHGGGIDKISEKQKNEIFLRYNRFLKINEKGCMGFWIGEWANDINWAPYRYLKNLEELVRLAYGVDGNGKLAYSLPIPPKTNLESSNVLEKIYKYKRSLLFNNAFGLNCAFPFDHYNLEWGGKFAAIELTVCGEGLSRYNLQTAFCRGAARQYNKPLFHYDAYFYGATVPDYIIKVNVKKALNPVGKGYGIPVSLGKRSMIHGYYSGATFFDFESQPNAFVESTEGGEYKLSPHGKVLEEFYSYSIKQPERGVPYTPVLLLLDYYHGWSPFIYDKVWFSLPYNDGDCMVREVMKTIWPYKTLFPVNRQLSNNCLGLVNTKYGDIFDVMTLNPPSGIISKEILNNYKVVFLLGNINMDDNSSKVLKDYVASGGTLVINSAQVNKFFTSDILGCKIPEYENKELILSTASPLVIKNKNIFVTKNAFGKGHIILTMPDNLITAKKSAHSIIDEVFSNISQEVLPFTVSGDIGYQLNMINPQCWILTLMNNKGVIKDPYKTEYLDASKEATVKIKSKCRIKSIIELTGNCSDLKVIGNTFISSVLPGDIKVYKINM